MAKCFITGVELNISNSYVLDISAAQRALISLRQRVASLERLIQQLSPRDNAEVYDVRKHQPVTKKFRRLVSAQVASALSATYPEETLFLRWGEWSARRRAILVKYFGAPKTAERTAIENDAGGDPIASGVEKQEACYAKHT